MRRRLIFFKRQMSEYLSRFRFEEFASYNINTVKEQIKIHLMSCYDFIHHIDFPQTETFNMNVYVTNGSESDLIMINIVVNHNQLIYNNILDSFKFGI